MVWVIFVMILGKTAMAILNFGTAMPITKFGTFKLSKSVRCAPVYGGSFTPLMVIVGTKIPFPVVTSPAPIHHLEE